MTDEEKRRRKLAYNKKYYAANRDKFLAYIRRPDVKARRKVTRAVYAQRPEVKERKRERDRRRYRAGGAAKQRANQRKTGYASTKQWRAKNRDKWNAYCRVRNKRKAAEKRAALEAEQRAERSAAVAHGIAAMETRHSSVDLV